MTLIAHAHNRKPTIFPKKEENLTSHSKPETNSDCEQFKLSLTLISEYYTYQAIHYFTYLVYITYLSTIQTHKLGDFTKNHKKPADSVKNLKNLARPLSAPFEELL